MPVPRGKKGVKQVMDEWKGGGLHSGSKTGPVVPMNRPDVAYAIAMRQAGMSKRAPRQFARKRVGTFRRPMSPGQIDRSKKDYLV